MVGHREATTPPAAIPQEAIPQVAEPAEAGEIWPTDPEKKRTPCLTYGTGFAKPNNEMFLKTLRWWLAGGAVSELSFSYQRIV